MTVTAVRKEARARTLTLVAEFDAPPERVWQLWSDPRQLERWWKEHCSGLRDRTTVLWGALMFNLWFERFAHGASTAASRGPATRPDARIAHDR